MKTTQIHALRVFCNFLSLYAKFLFFAGLTPEQVQSKLRKVSSPVGYLTKRILAGSS